MHSMPEAAALEIVHVGGPTVVLRLGGLTVLSDPTFDPPGEYPIGSRSLTKLRGPSVPAAGLGPYDLALVSHDQHPDNLDRAGAELLASIPVVLSTPEAARRLPGIVGLTPYETVELARPDGDVVSVTAVPARHGPVGCERLTGPVTGFVLAGEGLPSVYVSGDNAAVELVAEMLGEAGAVDVAILHVGAARTPLIDGALTLTNAEAVTVAGLLGEARVIPVHTEGWAHFSEGPEELAQAAETAGLGRRCAQLPVGEWVAVA